MKKKYSEMTRAEKRVAIAKDVINQIKKKKFIPNSGSYILGLDEFKPELDIKKNFAKIKKCEVCAMGACILSITKFSNILSFGDVGFDIYQMNNNKTKKLFSLFSTKQLLLIEHAFEGYNTTADRIASSLFNESKSLDSKTRDTLISFRNPYINDHSLLVGIMNNIIKNKGTFKP